MTATRPHIVRGRFQSDKYTWCHPDFVPLKVTDPMAQPVLWEYAQTRRAVDTEFASDLEYALCRAGYKPHLPSASPIVKWCGGKTKLLPELVRRMPRRFGRYFEPFAGGAALFFHIAPLDAVLADQNADLVNLYNVVARNADGLIARLGELERAHNKRHYYRMRKMWNERSTPERPLDLLERAALFVYLNKTCFNGLWRVNRSGQFNVPMGRYKRPNICDPDAIKAAHCALARATIKACDYSAAVEGATRGDLVFFDPPYDPLTETASFTGYSAGGFTSDDQRELADCFRHLVSRGCYVMLSNSNTRFIRSLYKGFRIDRVKCPRAINSDITKRASVTELIITGGY